MRSLCSVGKNTVSPMQTHGQATTCNAFMIYVLETPSWSRGESPSGGPKTDASCQNYETVSWLQKVRIADENSNSKDLPFLEAVLWVSIIFIFCWHSQPAQNAEADPKPLLIFREKMKQTPVLTKLVVNGCRSRDSRDTRKHFKELTYAYCCPELLR